MKLFRSHEIDLLPGESLDRFMGGRLSLIQSKDGYRFSIDAVMVADFVSVRPDDVAVDLGTGCGIIPLILLIQKKISYAIGLEIQDELASQAARNASLNGLDEKMAVVLGDIRDVPLSGKTADVVICNPPYRKIKSGRINPDPRRAIARHELMANSDDIVKAAGYLLRKKGRFAIVYPSDRLVDLFGLVRRHNLEPKRLRINYPDTGSRAKLVLLEAVLGGNPGLKIIPPLFGQGEYSIQDPP